MSNEKKLMRSTEDKMVSGVAAGLANYLSIDPVFVRLGAVLASLANPVMGIIIYFVMSLIMPTDGEDAAPAVANPFSDEEIVVKDSVKL